MEKRNQDTMTIKLCDLRRMHIARSIAKLGTAPHGTFLRPRKKGSLFEQKDNQTQ